MKIKTQFIAFTLAVTLAPVVVGLILLDAQRAPRDPRQSTRAFLSRIDDRPRSGNPITVDELASYARAEEMPVREIALITKEGDVLASSFPHLPPGSRVSVRDLVRRPRGGREPDKPEMQLMAVDYADPDSDLVLFDFQPFWTRQDIRNRNILIVSAFAFGLFLIAGAISLVILRSIVRAIQTIESDTAIVATGDLDHQVKGSADNEFRSLAASINLMRLNLKDMLARRARMLMGVSHDLKTPIALIQGYADALSDEMAVDAETRARYVRIIREKAGQLEDLASDLVDFLKIGSDGSYAVAAVDPVALAADLGARFESDARLMGRDFRWGFGDGLDRSPPFRADPIPMNRALAERALENIVMNAFKFSGPGGRVELSLAHTPEGTCFRVSDDGPGIAEADRPYVFDAFYRASPSRADGGHGLGLTVVKAVCELHGWQVSIGPRRDGLRGSEVRLLLSGGRRA